MWPFSKKDSKSDFSNYVSFDDIVGEPGVALSDNELIAVEYGLSQWGGKSAHPQAVNLIRASIAGSLVAYAIFMIRRYPSFDERTIDATFAKAYSYLPAKTISDERQRFFNALKMDCPSSAAQSKPVGHKPVEKEIVAMEAYISLVGSQLETLGIGGSDSE